MPDKKKSLIKNSALYVGLGFLPLAVNLVLAPIYSEYILPEEYGLVALSNILQGFLAVIISFGLDSAFSRLYFDYHKKEKLIKGLLSTTLLGILIGASLIWIVLLFSGDWIFATFLSNKVFTYSKYGNIVFATTFSTVIHAIFLSYYRNQENALTYSIVSLSFFFSTVMGVLIGVVYLEAQAMGNIAGRAVGASFVALVLILGYFFRHPFQFKFSYLKNCLNYSLPLIPYLALLMAYNNIDKIMIEQYFPLNTLGLYNFAFLLSSVISIFIYAIYNAISPRIYKLLTETMQSTYDEIRKISLLFHLLILGLICAGIALIVPVLKIFIAEEYQAIENYIALLLLVYIFQVYYVIYTIPIFFNKKTKVLPLISLIVLIIGITSNILFIPILGIYGVCLSLLITKLMQFIVTYGFNIYFGYDKYSFLLLTKNHALSLLLIIVFVALFVFNNITQLFPVYLINLAPIFIFTLFVGAFFRGELSSLKMIFKTIFT